jgi:polyisoprenoid-binding protein YceI
MIRSLWLVAALAPMALAQAAETYAVDPSHTHATFKFEHMGLSTFTGKFAGATGTLTLDQSAKTGVADITFDAKSIATGVPKLDEHLQGADFFDVQKFPTITFKSKKFEYKGNKLAAVSGDLTVKGIPKPVTFTVDSTACKEHPMAKKPACGANAHATVKRSDYGMIQFIPAVGDDIPLDIEIEAIKQ